MSTAVTHGIRVSVLPRFEPEQGAPGDGRHLFSYRITIANRGRRTVQLLRRHWYIRDSLAPRTEVEGPGVVGATPVVEPGGSFTYSSYCQLHGSLGRMEGTYRMKYVDDGREFNVAIPPFDLHVPHAAN